MFKNDKKLVKEEDLFRLLDFRDSEIKKILDEKEEFLLKIQNKQFKEIQSLKDKLASIQENFRKFNEETKDIKKQISKYCYCVEYDKQLTWFENKDLFKEWFIDNIYQKKQFKANNKAWGAIYEVIGELKNVEMAEEDIA